MGGRNGTGWGTDVKIVVKREMLKGEHCRRNIFFRISPIIILMRSISQLRFRPDSRFLYQSSLTIACDTGPYNPLQSPAFVHLTILIYSLPNPHIHRWNEFRRRHQLHQVPGRLRLPGRRWSHNGCALCHWRVLGPWRGDVYTLSCWLVLPRPRVCIWCGYCIRVP